MAKVQSNYQGKEGAYYIVNPQGTVHACTREHAEWRLRSAGYRLAEDGEIEQYLEKKTQRFQAPIAERWSPTVEIVEPVPEEVVSNAPLATEKALEVAAEHGIDLSAVEGTGADGRILVRDVEALVKK